MLWVNEVADLDAVVRLPALQHFSATLPTPGMSLKALRGAPALRQLSLWWGTPPQVLTGIGRYLPQLETLDLSGEVTQALDAVRDLKRLRSLTLRADGSLDLRPLRGMNLRLRLLHADEYLGLDELGPGVKVSYD